MRTASLVLLGLSSTVCSAPQICDGVEGGCLVLRVDGTGTFETLRSTALSASNATLKVSDVAQNVTLPTVLRLPSPPGVVSDNIQSLRVEGLTASMVTANGSTSGFSWPAGTNVEARVTLMPGSPIPPGPFLTWREEMGPTGVANLLYDVWVDPAGEPVLAVGENGTAMRRTGGLWSAEATGTTSGMYSVFGIAGGTSWAGGQGAPTILRRDGTGMSWSVDQPAGLMGVGLWAVTTGQTVGEVWVGDNDGKVWHRTGPTTGAGTWTMEQALPAGRGVYGIAYADGAVFAVGDAGNVAVRKDSQAATPWTRTQIMGNFSTSDWWNGVWAFDRNTAVAVGTVGSLITYQGGNWTQSAQKIDTANSEMTSVWGLNLNKVWVTSKNGFILRVDGTTIYKLYQKQNVALNSIYGLSETNIYAVGGTNGQPSLILHGTP